MKVFVGVRNEKERCIYSLTVYAGEGRLLYSVISTDARQDSKFENPLRCIQWAADKLKVLIANGTLSNSEDIDLFINNKVIYGWFEKGVAPKPYTYLLSDLELTLSFIPNKIEIFYTASKDKLLFKNSKQEEVTKVTDMFKDYLGGI